ncbi:MAG: hypothetical protein AAF609_18555 [Cyanobacteria bacterium P01_C01_bin.120]
MKPWMMLGFPVAVMSIGVVSTSMDAERSDRQSWQRRTASAEVNQQIQADRLAAESDLAESRYVSGACVLAGQQLQSGMVAENISPGSAVCDRFGNTAMVLDNNALGDFARTNNESVIRRFMGW